MARRLMMLVRQKTKRFETSLEVKSNAVWEFFKTTSKENKGLLEDSLISGELWIPRRLPNLEGYGELEASPGILNPSSGLYNYSWLRHVQLNEGLSIPLSTVLSQADSQAYVNGLKNVLNILWLGYMQDREVVTSYTVDSEVASTGIFMSGGVSTADPL